jgi:hypothetical protein
VKKRKRAPGGGRKPKGEFSNLSANITIRMPSEMREQLNRAAAKSSRSLAQEMLWRLRLSFQREREKDRSPAVRAICFLIGEIARSVMTPENNFFHSPVLSTDSEIAADDWRSDPFFYKAFRIAVGAVLQELTPPGEIVPPQTIKNDPNDNRYDDRYFNSWQTPEARAKYAADWTINTLRHASDTSNEWRAWEDTIKEMSAHPSFSGLASSLSKEFYGIQNAARDLRPRPVERLSKDRRAK